MNANGEPEVFKFRLFLAQDAPNSDQARANLAAFCLAYLPGRHDIEVVDVFREPRRALAEGVMLTPTLIKISPGPVRRIVGSLSQPQVLRDSLGLGASAA